MKTKAANIVLFFGIIALLFSAISVFTAVPSTEVSVEGGGADLTGIDLSRQVAAVRPERFDYYPGVYLSPGSFDGAPAPRYFTDADKSDYQYGTFRVTLRLPAGKTYAVRAMAINFSQRTWIDGVEQEPVGWPGETAKDTVPAAREAVYVFTPESDTTEIVMQYANFVYRGGGEPYPLYVSSYQNIARLEQLSLFRACIIAGCMFTIFVFYMGMYLFFRRRGYFLAFAVSCLAVAVRSLLIGEKFLTRLWPDVSWYGAMAAEYIGLVVTVSAFILYIAGMFPGLLHKWGLRLYTGFSAAFALLSLVTPPLIYSRFLIVYQAVSVLYGIYMIVLLVRHILKHHELESALVLAGGGLFLAAIIAEAYLHSRVMRFGLSGIDQPAMMVFIFANMIALAVRYARTERELLDMTELNRMKTEFLNQASHDLKTPVAAMGLALQRLAEVKDENQRGRFVSAALKNHADMARLVGNLLSVARLETGSQRYRIAPLPVEKLCVKIQEKYEDTLEAHGVELDVSTDTLGEILCDENLLWSVLDNLIYNALRYTPKGGAIRIKAALEGERIVLAVSDTGCGILPEHLPHIFERGYMAGDKGGTGMGLYIVKTAMEGMDGSVTADNAAEGGARFTLYFPAKFEKALEMTDGL